MQGDAECGVGIVHAEWWKIATVDILPDPRNIDTAKQYVTRRKKSKYSEQINEIYSYHRVLLHNFV